MMALNEIIDVRDLEVGSVFLVPPKAGTYTPVPTTPPPTLTPTPVPPTLTPYVALRPVNAATIQVTPLAALTQPPTAPAAGIATAAAAPAWLETVSPSPEATQTPTVTAESAAGAVAVALAPTGEPLVAAAVLPPTPENNTNTLLIVAILVQVGVIGAAAISFLRGGRKARRP
jgi:hypothetical protein